MSAQEQFSEDIPPKSRHSREGALVRTVKELCALEDGTAATVRDVETLFTDLRKSGAHVHAGYARFEHLRSRLLAETVLLETVIRAASKGTAAIEDGSDRPEGFARTDADPANVEALARIAQVRRELLSLDAALFRGGERARRRLRALDESGAFTEGGYVSIDELRARVLTPMRLVSTLMTILDRGNVSPPEKRTSRKRRVAAPVEAPSDNFEASGAASETHFVGDNSPDGENLETLSGLPEHDAPSADAAAYTEEAKAFEAPATPPESRVEAPRAPATATFAAPPIPMTAGPGRLIVMLVLAVLGAGAGWWFARGGAFDHTQAAQEESAEHAATEEQAPARAKVPEGHAAQQTPAAPQRAPSPAPKAQAPDHAAH